MDPTASMANALDQSNESKRLASQNAFNATWQAADATLLQPSALSMSKVLRGWDRKPLSPFSKQRLRVGKVWKRAASSQRPTISDTAMDPGHASKRRKARTSLTAPLKPVKKMCLDSSFGMAPQVLQWESVGSPARKIVTRSTASGEDMLALPADDNEGSIYGEVDVTVEILDEDGTVLEVGGEELEKETEWQDETNFGELLHEQNRATPTTQMSSFGSMDTDRSTDASNITPAARVSSSSTEATQNGAHSSICNGQACTSTILPIECVTPQECFTSGTNGMSAWPTKHARVPLDLRRRTLPIEFAPSIEQKSRRSLDVTTVALHTYDDCNNPTVCIVDPGPAGDISGPRFVPNELDNEQDASSEEEWQDVEYDLAPSAPDLELQPRGDSEDAGDQISAASNCQAINGAEAACDRDVTEQNILPRNLYLDTRLPSSPIPTFEGQHPRLPLRRSSRRKSSSPLKQSKISGSTKTSHLIALTPIRGSLKYPSPSSPSLHTLSLNEEEDVSAVQSPIDRAASAPPEQVAMSPHRPARPRVSDDTALLQAFLNRAAENRSSRRVSASKQESITNRRDSDTVRQALASPVKLDVLVDLDPNTPSPRKPAANMDGADVFSGMELSCLSTPERLDDGTDARITRRSDRMTRRAQLQTPPAPNKIAIRGNAEYTILKKTEAQELATLTRNNTRKNKGGAVLPPVRIHKLAFQTTANDQGTDEGYENEERVEPATRRGVKWAETLVEFYQGGEVSESSILSDELNAPPYAEQPPDSEPACTAPSPSETPSKPKLRRLKTPRTASTAASLADCTQAVIPEVEESASAAPEAQPQGKPAPSMKKRSRIATPAKGLTNACFLPSDLDRSAPVMSPAAPGDKKPHPKKKSVSSKLPAPLVSSASLGQGKENLISSPPKKRTGGVPTSKTFAPKLDLSRKTHLPLEEGAAAPGLASPAKKGRGKTIAMASLPIPDLEAARKSEMPGLSSPAKKRTRRAGGV